MIWADQTLLSGMDKPMEKVQVDAVLEGLKKLQVRVIDVRVRNWHRNNLPPLNEEQRTLFRGVVRGTVEEVKLAYKLGFRQLVVAEHLQQGQGLTKQSIATLGAGRTRNIKMGFLLENASQFPLETIKKIGRDIFLAGAETFIYGDGESLLQPLSTLTILGDLVSSIPGCIEFHGHNAYGLATANALGAMQAGVKGIATAIAGVGCQGHAALEEVLMARKCLFEQAVGDTKELAAICPQILGEIGMMVAGTKAIIGEEIFAHESGIHVDGVLKNPQLYEPFPPEEVGLSRKLVIGKHSGTAAIQAKFQQWNRVLSSLEARVLLEKVRSLAVEQKRQVDDQQLWNLYNTAVG